MRKLHPFAWLVLATLATIAPAAASAQQDDPADDPAPAPRSARRSGSRVLNSQQIDRYEAIRQLRVALKADPANEGDWIILGELAHEVALDLPSDQDDAYYRLSRDAYERALRLDPDNAGLRAAVQFARDQEANSQQFDDARRQSSRSYLDARRREVAASGFAPTIRDDSAAQASALSDPADDPADDPAAPRRRAQAPRPSSGPAYRPYSSPKGPAVTYGDYADSYAPPPRGTPGQQQPMTLRGLAAELPDVLLNEARRGRGAAPTPRPR